MILVFDTETTGVPKKYSAPVSDLENWPRLVQLGWFAMHDDGTPAGSMEYIIKPDGFVIPEEASAIHHITQADAEIKGIPISKVLASFLYVVKQTTLLVGHNVEFDLNIVGAEFIRWSGKNYLDGIPSLCTMKAGIDFCKLPKTSSRGTDKYKWPRLEELYWALFNSKISGAHTALQDVRSTARCYLEMKSRGIIK